MSDEMRNQSSGASESMVPLKPKEPGPAKKKPSGRICLSPRACILAGIVLIAWLLVFGAGILINSEPYRESVTSWQAPHLSWGFLLAVFMVVLTWTPLNIALLAGAAGLLGAQALYAGLVESEQESPDVTNPYFSALLRGFYIYLLFISGMLVIVETPFSKPTQEQYLRLAGLVSLISFLVNYKLGLFAKLLRYSARRIEQQGKEAPAKPDADQ